MDFSLQRRRLLTFLLFLLTGAAWANNTVTIDKAGSQADPVNVGPILFRVVFDEAVTGFDDTDVNLSSSTTSGTLVATVTEIAPNDGTTYEVSVSGMTGTGNVVASISANAAKLVSDGTTNTAASTSTDNTVRYDISPPTVISLNPTDDQTGVAVNSNLQILFSSSVNLGTGTIELRQYSDDTVIESYTLPGSSRVSITGGNTLVINPSSNLSPNNQYYLIIPAGAVNDNATNDFAGLITKGDWDFTTVNPAPDVQTETPADNATGVSASLNVVTITFTESVSNVGDNSNTNNRIIIKDLTNNNTLETIDPTAAGKVVLSGGGLTADIHMTVALSPGTHYAVKIGNSVFEDVDGANFSGTTNDNDWDFTTEDVPSFTFQSPSSSTASSTCVGETVTLVGVGFGTAPIVLVNGTPLQASDYILPNPTPSTKIQFKAPASIIGSFDVVVKNTVNGLSSAPTTINFKPAILTNLNVFASPASASVGGASSIKIDGTQTNVDYQLVLISPNTNIGNNQTGNGSQLSFATDATPGGAVYPTPGPTSYAYKFTVASAGCTLTELTNHATVSVSAVTADAGGDKNLCIGDGVTIGGSPTASGGTGYLSISWTGPSFASTSPNPTVTVAGTYTVTVKDNTGATETDDVLVTGLTKPTINFVDTLRSQFTYSENKYQLSNKTIVSPNDGSGVFSGQGVSLNSDNKYYFNPQAFTTQSANIPITYTHTSANGCSDSKTFTVDVNVPGSVILNLKAMYCPNEGSTSGIAYNTGSYPLPPGKAFSDMKVYQTYDGINGVYITYPTSDPNYPLTRNSSTSYTFNPTKAYNLMGGAARVFLLIYLKDATTQVEDAMWVNFGYTDIVALGAQPDILPMKQDVIVCEKDPPVTLSNTFELANLGYTTLNYQETTYNSVLGSGAGPYTFNPDVVNFGGSDVKPVTIKYNYTDNNGCLGSTQRSVFVVRKVGGPAAFDQQYCQFFDGKRVLTAESQYTNEKITFAWYTSSSLSDITPGTGSVFDTEINTQNPVTKTYYVTQNFRGCESDYKAVNIVVAPAPVLNLNFASPCENRPFTFVGPVPPGVNPSYSWSFSGDSQSYDTKDVVHTFANNGPASVSLVVKSTTNGQECSTSATQSLVVGQNPTAAVTFDQLCDGDNTNFHASSGGLTIESIYWDFGDGDVWAKSPKATVINDPAGRTSGTYVDPHHKFIGGQGEYTVELRVYTAQNCSDTTKRTLRILPYLTAFNSLNPYHMEEINAGDGFWAVDSASVNSTWQFVAPNDTVIHNINKAWVTNGDKNVNFGDYNSNEHSAVNSPCFDITGFERPVFAMDFIAYTGTDSGKDGAVLQVSTDGGLTWKVIGNKDSGLNWYNTIGVSGSAPGEQSVVAWSGDLWTTNVDKTDSLWLQAKHTLDLPENILPSAKRNKVRFRVAFASNGDTEFEGVAFNNVHIEDRNRIMLVENFTNATAVGAGVNNTRFSALQDDVVKIQYNVSFPGEDDINLQNPTDPGARGAFYGIANTDQVVPRVYIDGTSGGKLTGPTDWFDQSKSLRSLVTSPLDISISTVPASASQLSVVAQITPNQALTEGKLVVHVAIVENPVDGNVFVLRKMLPNASGTVLPLPLTTGVPIILPALTWQVDNTHVDPANLAVVVFVQNEDTKEVLQAAMLEHPADLPTAIVTGTEPSFSQQTSLYPNPADHQLIIHMPQAARKDMPLSVFDTFGHEVLQRTVVTGEQQVLVNTTSFAAGVYLIQFEPSPGVQVRKKVVVTHR